MKVAYIGLEESVTTTYERMLSECMGVPFYLMSPKERRENEAEMRAAAKTFAHNLCLLDRFGMDDLRSFIATVKPPSVPFLKPTAQDKPEAISR